MENKYSEYIEYISSSVKEYNIRQFVNSAEALGKFRLSADDTWKPVDYKGYTLITPTLPDDNENRDSYQVLSKIKKLLSGILNPLKVVQAPDSAMHMTVARLVSGEVFEKEIMGIREDELIETFRELFSKLPAPYKMRFEVKGITVFPQGIIAAVLSPVCEDEYESLQKLRNHIYEDKIIQKLGVERRRSFKGHITLFYLEKELTAVEKQTLAHSIIELNEGFFDGPVPFCLERAEVRKFDNFLSFYREKNWPALKLV